jgi:lysyl-tRNA synthetase class 1
MADHYISEFFSVFGELGIRPEFYRMRDIYRSGKFNEAIDAILRKADVVRRIYKEVSGSERPDHWHPFQVVCEKCGRVGTTVVSAYDGKEVTYECKPDLVKWAVGCGHRGKMSPFDGKGKLPWKLEWCAKWRTFPVTIEGRRPGSQHQGRLARCRHGLPARHLRPATALNCPYDFFLVGGAKMSSSKGIGVTSRDMANFLPPDILRFLLIRPTPRQPVNFEPSEVYIIKLFNEFDRLHQKYFNDPKITADEKRIYELSKVDLEPAHWLADFQLVAALSQMPHLDIVKELERRKGSPFTDLERKHLELRIRAARYWVENYASEEEKTRLQETLPARAQELTQTQRAFLQILAAKLPDTPWEGDALQVSIFNAARLTPIDQPAAFKAIYRVLLDRENGPKAGNFLSFLDRKFVEQRFRELPVDKAAFWKESAVDDAALQQWLGKERPNISSVLARCENVNSASIVELVASMNDGKTHCRRVLVEL